MMKNKQIPILLIVSDRLAVRRWIKTALRDQFHIIEDKTGHNVISTLNNYWTHIIFIDAKLKDVSFTKLCKEIRNLKDYKDIPIILITGKLNKTYRTKALQVGVTNFLSDLLDQKELLYSVESSQQIIASRNKVIDLSKKITGPSLVYDKTLSSQEKKALSFIDKTNKTIYAIALQINNFSTLIKKLPSSSRKILLLQLEKKIRPLIKEDLLIPPEPGQFIILSTRSKKDLSILINKLQQILSNMVFIYKQEKLVANISIRPIILSQEQLKNLSPKKKFDRIIGAAHTALINKKKEDLTIKFEIRE